MGCGNSSGDRALEPFKAGSQVFREESVALEVGSKQQPSGDRARLGCTVGITCNTL